MKPITIQQHFVIDAGIFEAEACDARVQLRQAHESLLKFKVAVHNQRVAMINFHAVELYRYGGITLDELKEDMSWIAVSFEDVNKTIGEFKHVYGALPKLDPLEPPLCIETLRSTGRLTRSAAIRRPPPKRRKQASATA